MKLQVQILASKKEHELLKRGARDSKLPLPKLKNIVNLNCHFHFYFLVRIITNEFKISSLKGIYVLLQRIDLQNLHLNMYRKAQ